MILYFQQKRKSEMLSVPVHKKSTSFKKACGFWNNDKTFMALKNKGSTTSRFYGLTLIQISLYIACFHHFSPAHLCSFSQRFSVINQCPIFHGLQKAYDSNHKNPMLHCYSPFSCLYLSIISFAVSRSILESTASPLMKVEKGSSSFLSFSSIFWISLSRRRRTVG